MELVLPMYDVQKSGEKKCTLYMAKYGTYFYPPNTTGKC